MEAIDHLTQNLQNAKKPWVLQPEDKRIFALFYDVADERNHQFSVLVLESLDKQLLDVKLVAANGSISGQSELAKELAQSLQVLLDLAHSASSSADLVRHFVEFDFVNQEAPLEDLRCDLDSP